ncbi:MAG: LptF/LptG family permease [Pseudomonadota bacterium]
MFRILQRYLAAHFIIPFVVSLTFFVVFLLTFQLFHIIKLITSKGVDVATIWNMVVDMAMSFVPMAMPLSCFFAVIYIMGKLSEDSEVVAMRSFGLSKSQLFRPFLILGAVIAVTVYILAANIVPLAKKEFTNTFIRLTSRGMLNDIKAGGFFMDIPGVSMFAEKSQNQKMQGVMIHLADKNNNGEKVVFARRGVLIKESPKDEWDLPNLRMHLSDGNSMRLDTQSNQLEKILFQDYDFPLMEQDEGPGFITKDSMRTNRELWRIIRRGPKDKDKDKDKGKTDRGFIKTQLELGERVKTPLECLLFIFLGFSLGIKKGRGRSRDTGALAFACLGLYYTMYFVGVTVTQKGMIHPYFVSIFPVIFFWIIGLFFYRKLDWPA